MEEKKMKQVNFTTSKKTEDHTNGDKGIKTTIVQFNDILSYSVFDKKTYIETKGVDIVLSDKEDCERFVKWYQENNNK